MSLTFTKVPAASNRILNQLAVALSSDAYIDTAGIKASIVISFSAIPTTGSEITLVWASGSTTITVDYSGTYPNANFWVEFFFAETLYSNLAIRSNFNIAYASGAVTLTAKTATADLSFTSGSCTTDLNNTTLGSYVAGVTQVLKTNFQIKLDVWIEQVFGSELYEPLINKTATPDNLGVAIFRINEDLKSFMTVKIPKLNDPVNQQATETIKRFYIRATEAWNIPVQTSSYDKSPSLFSSPAYYLAALAGRLEYNRSALEDRYTESNIEKKGFLSNINSDIILRRDQPIYLDFFLTGQGISVTQQLRGTIISEDGLTSESIFLTISSSRKGIVRYKFTLSSLTLSSSWIGKTVARVENIMPVAFGTAALGNFTFNINFDLKPRRHYLYFLFENAYGGWDPLYCTGEYKINGRFEGKDVEYYSDNLNIAFDGLLEAEFKKTDTEWMQSIEVNTGYKRRKDIYQLKELWNKQRAVWVFGDKYIEGTVTKRDSNLEDTTDDLFYATFVFEIGTKFQGNG